MKSIKLFYKGKLLSKVERLFYFNRGFKSQVPENNKFMKIILHTNFVIISSLYYDNFSENDVQESQKHARKSVKLLDQTNCVFLS